jgi:hypothetical protein
MKRAIAPFLRNDLARLGRLYGTNKASEKQYYIDYYRAHLGRFRRRPIRLLEIGIGGYVAGPQSGGSSLRMWRSWMPRAQIFGIDLDERAFDEPRIRTFAGSQADAMFLKSVEDAAGPFDVVIDDGSHVGQHIRASFEALWPGLRPGGVYVIEDLQTAFMEEYEGGPVGTPGTAMELIKELADTPTLDGDIAELHLYRRIAFVVKRAPAA